MQKFKLYKLTPKDMEQMSNDQVLIWQNELRVFLNQLPLKKDEADFKKAGILDNVFALPSKSNNDYFFKFYSLNEELFLETNFNEVLSLPSVSMEAVENQLSKIVGMDEIHSDATLGDDYVKINGLYIRLVNVYEYSKTIMPSGLMDFGDYCLFFKKVATDIAKRRVNTQRKLHHSNLHSAIRNLESEASFLEAEKITEAMTNGEENLFDVEAWFILKADSLENLNQQTQELIRSLRQAEIIPYIEAEGLKELFPAILFGVAPTFKRTHQCPTTYLVNLLPVKHDELHDNGIGLYSERGNEIYFNLFDEEALNYNVLISGQSGTGKSMIAQKILKEELANGASVIVLDLGNSFSKTARYLGGETLSLSFNPLQFKSPHYLKELIISVIPASELTSKMEGKIFSLIKDHAEEISSFKELILKISAQIPDLELYFSELWEFFSENESPEKELSKLTYVDTSLYPDKIKAPLIIFLIESFKHIEGKKIFIFDEVWSFLTKNADYIAECFRTFRKHGASAIAISQGLDDFTSTILGKVIAQNSYTKILFHQNSEGLGFLDDFDQQKIKSLSTKVGAYSEFYIKTEILRKLARFYPSSLEYELFTSNHDDNLSFSKFEIHYHNYFPFWNIVERWVDFKYYHQIIHQIPEGA
jgi:hypothetical protein